MRKAAGIGLVALGSALGGICLLAWGLPLKSSLSGWLATFIGVLIYLHLGFDVAVFSLCGGAALLSGVLLLTISAPAITEKGTAEGGSRTPQGGARGWRTVRLLLHLAVVYAIAAFATPQLGAWTKNTLLPFLQRPTSSGSLQFLFSHVFALSFIPGFLAGLANARFKHKVAQYVWLAPAIILAYKIFTFPAPAQSVFASWFSLHQQQLSSAFQQYFGGGFVIREHSDYSDFWSIWRSNPDMARGMGQLRFTAPFYAAVGYCLAACIALRTQLHSKLGKRVKDWEQWKFGRSV